MSAALKLELFQNGELLREVPLDSSELWVGRDEDCGIHLDDRAISRKHGLIRANALGIAFEKKSKFGLVKLNGKEIDQMTLKNGDRLEMGPYEIRVLARVTEKELNIPENSPEEKNEVEVQTVAIPEAIDSVAIDFSSPEGVDPLNFDLGTPEVPVVESGSAQFDFSKVETEGATKVFSAPQKLVKAVLQFADGAANVTDYEIGQEEVAIGRSQNCHLILEDKRSSRKHSIIKRDGEHYLLKDLGSVNGTLVNGERVDEHRLESGDVIQIGDTQFVFKLLQSDYEQKKNSFFQVPAEEVPASLYVSPEPQHLQNHHELPPYQDLGVAQSITPDFSGNAPLEPAPDFVAPPEEKKSFIGKFLDRYRAMNTKQQIIYGAAILAGVYFMLDDPPPAAEVKGSSKTQQKIAAKKAERTPGSVQSLENLTEEQKKYIETEYQIAFDLFKNREYDSALLASGKIFALVQDYKHAREIEAMSREGKRKLEALEEDRKKKEAERLAQAKLRDLLEQTSALMEKKRFQEAENKFPEIELIQPENSQVAEWRKLMITERENLEKIAQEKKRVQDLTRVAWGDYRKAQDQVNEKNYWDALDAFDELLSRKTPDKKLQDSIKADILKVETLIAAERDPLIAQGKQLEQDGKLSEAYRFFQKAFIVDGSSEEASQGMNRIHGTLNAKAKSIYAEGVFAESFTDFETAEKKYREVLDVVSTDDDYYQKATTRLKKITVLRKPATAEGVQ